MARILLSIAILSSAGTTPPADWPEANKAMAEKFTPNVNATLFILAIGAFERVSGLKLGEAEVNEIAEKIETIALRSTPWDCTERVKNIDMEMPPGTTFICHGLSGLGLDNKWHIQVAVTDCPADSSLVHEYLHVIMYEVMGSPDPRHENKNFKVFDKISDYDVTSAQGMAQAAGRIAICRDRSATSPRKPAPNP